MRYIPLSEKDRNEMLADIGAASINELFRGIPQNLLVKKEIDVPKGLPEEGVLSLMRSMAGKNNPAATSNGTFLGAGSYNHFIPSAIDHLTSRSEWYSAYTPYQPEISQGTLQAIYEYQSYVCGLFGMEAANASMYDGASAMAEAVMMAARISGKTEVVVSDLVHPRWRGAARTFVRNRGIKVVETSDHPNGKASVEKLEAAVNGNTGAIVVQSPNFFGSVEDLDAIGNLCRSKGILFVVGVAEAISLGMYRAPGEFGADIVVGEGQSLGLHQSFGGPYLGMFATRKEHLRQMPGRLCGKTTDVNGNDGFVLTLSAREQHIRRDKATSNICTNQALCALRASIYLSLLGKGGFRKTAKRNYDAATALRKKLKASKKVELLFDHPYFNETVVRIRKNADTVNWKLAKYGVVGGLDVARFYPGMKNAMLLAATELTTPEQIDILVKTLEG